MDDPSKSANHGMIVSGGTVNQHNTAVGQNARVDVHAPAVPDELREQLDALLSAIEAHDAPPATRDAMRDAAGDVQAELERPEPDRGKLLEGLNTIGGLAGVATAVANAATAVLRALG
jgi:hypothetical protein